MWRLAAIGLAAAGLAACVPYHQERPALRMARPNAEPPELSAYAPPNADYPSVGGDIRKGTAPTEEAAYQATTGGETTITPPPPQREPTSP